MSRDISKATDLLQEFWPKLLKWYQERHPGCSLVLVHVDRSAGDQLRLFCKGRIEAGQRVTYKDGYNNLSKHNAEPSQAIDIAATSGGLITWNDIYYADLGTAVEELGYSDRILWGGSFHNFKDYGHFETK